MARGPRRRRGAPDRGGPHADDDADLGAPEHAWWAQRDINVAPHVDEGLPIDEGPRPEPVEPSRDVLAEHLGPDWRTSFGFDHPGPVVPPPRPGWEPEPAPVHEPDAPTGTSDPYGVLGVAATATWDEIVDAHRSLARRHHPDRLLGRPPVEVEAAEQRIRDINVAYQEIRVRRGK